MTFEQLQYKLHMWAIDKNIIGSSNEQISAQQRKFNEEVDEFNQELYFYLQQSTQNNKDALKLELGDVLVTIIILAANIGIDPVNCLELAYDKISKRTGRTINGVFVKD